MELFHFDIETASQYNDYKTFIENDERGAKLFEKKFYKMNWDEKYSSIDMAYEEMGCIMSTYGRIVCISCGFIDDKGNNRITSYFGTDEEDLLNQFNDVLKKVEKKNFNLCGFRIVNFDIPWVLHKLHKYGIEPANIIKPYGKKPWDVRVVDMASDWKQRFAWSNTFDEMCYELNIESPKDNLDGSMVNKYFWEGKLEEIKDYCEKDVKSSIEVSKKIYQ